MIKLKAFVKADYLKSKGPVSKHVEKPPVPKWLEIEEYVFENDTIGFYLFYHDDNDEIYCDDFYRTLNDAINNAYWECRVEPEDWQVVRPEDWETVVEIGNQC